MVLLDEKGCPSLGLIDILGLAEIPESNTIGKVQIIVKEKLLFDLEEMAQERKDENYIPQSPEEYMAITSENKAVFNSAYEEIHQSLESLNKSILALKVPIEVKVALNAQLSGIRKAYLSIGRACTNL